MSIKALPPSTVRIIGSSQVLTDPASVVKELVDNALDARATSIFVEIAVNTIDIVQVRDNGHGIAPDDRALVCKRYCTSKIREYADLKDIGGKWLGFRGEALASAAELSSSLLVTTRVEGEDVAVALKVNTRGEVEQQDKASHPIGTTIRVNEIFKFLPVRKQNALKISAKTLSKIKRMLQTYALARPLTRYSLRVLKAKNDKANWMYVPSSNAGVEDAAFKVVGKDCAGQCDWMVVDHHGFEVQAFLPRSNADVSKISNVGNFVFVDSRPVSTSRGLLKQVMALFKDKLRGCTTGTSVEKPKDPFIWLNIICPPQSYDANIEPAKDDVLFEDSSKVLEAVEKLLDQAYPQPVVPGMSEMVEDVEILGSQEQVQLVEISNMLAGNDEDLPPIVREDVHQEDVESMSGLRDINVSNPWIMAKMHSSTQPRRTSSRRNGHLVTPLQERNGFDVNSMSVTEASFPPHPPWMLPTPEASSSPLREGRTGDNDVTDVRNSDSHIMPAARQHSDEDEALNNGRAGKEESVPQDRRNQYRGWKAATDFIPAGELPLSTPLSARISSITLPETSLPHQAVHSPLRRQLNRRRIESSTETNKPFVSPVKHDSRVWFEEPGQSNTTKNPNASKRRRGVHQDLDLQYVLDAAEDAGLRAAKRQRRQQLSIDADMDDDMLEETAASESGPLQSTLDDFLNGRHRAVVDEETPQIRTFNHIPSDLASIATDSLHHSPLLRTEFSPAPCSLEIPSLDSNREHQSNPHHRLLTTTHNSQPPKPHNPFHRPTRAPSRTISRTARLALERVPHGAELHNLLVNVSLSITILSSSLRRFLRSDECLSARESGDGSIGARAWGAAADVCNRDDKHGGEDASGGMSVSVGGSGFDDPPLDDADVEAWSARLDELLHSLQVEEASGGLNVTTANEAGASVIRPALTDALNACQQHVTIASQMSNSAAIVRT